jgi:hypothetical protein
MKFTVVPLRVNVRTNYPIGDSFGQAKIPDKTVFAAVAAYRAGGKSQDQVAAEFGVSRRSLRQWLAGERRTIPTKIRMARRPV